MILLYEVIILLLVVFLWWFKNDRDKYLKYPPGPFRLPFIGNLLQLFYHAANLPSTTFSRLADLYGDVMFIKMGGTDVVVFSSQESIHDMLNHDKATHRHKYEFVKDRHGRKELGLVWSSGDSWQTLRRFTMRNLRDFGFGKSSAMDSVIDEEVEKFMADFSKQVKNAPGNVIHVTDPFSLSVVNVLWRLVSGKVYELDDPKVKRLIYLNREWMKSVPIGFDLTEIYPKLRDWFPNWSGRTLQRQLHQELYEYGKELLYEQRELDSCDAEPETFIDVFNRKIEDSKDDPNTAFNDEQFVLTILDLFLGGSDTSSNTLNFGLIYMILNPEVQEKVQSELDREVPEGIPIYSSMKSRLPYTCATVLETLRHSTIIPIISYRQATEDFYYKGHYIKKGTALMPNLMGLHFSEKVWGDPKAFRPERFLNADGTAIDQKVADRLKSFGGGHRFCLGKSLAELTVFQYFTSVLRRFKFVKVPGNSPTTEPFLGLTLAPRPYDVRVIDRSRLKH